MVNVINPVTNTTVVAIKDLRIYFSYETIVAVQYVLKTHLVQKRTNVKYSKTTSRHLSQLGVATWDQISHEGLEQMIETYLKTAI